MFPALNCKREDTAVFNSPCSLSASFILSAKSINTILILWVCLIFWMFKDRLPDVVIYSAVGLLSTNLLGYNVKSGWENQTKIQESDKYGNPRNRGGV